MQAQESYSIQYVIGIPTDDLNDFIDRTSFRGLFFEYQYALTSQFIAGFAAYLTKLLIFQIT